MGQSRYFAKSISSAECNVAETGENVIVQFNYNILGRSYLFIGTICMIDFSDFQCVLWTASESHGN